MSPRVPLQKGSLRAIPDRIPALRDDVTAREAWPGIPVSAGQKKKQSPYWVDPRGITSTNRMGIPGYKEVVQFMGRTFLSVRQGVNEIAGRWERASKKYRCGKKVVRVAKMYSSEGFMGCNDPLESVLFSVAVEIQKMYPNLSASVGNQDRTNQPE